MQQKTWNFYFSGYLGHPKFFNLLYEFSEDIEVKFRVHIWPCKLKAFSVWKYSFTPCSIAEPEASW